MSDINAILQAPEWTMQDAYGDIGSARYEQSFAEIDALIQKTASYAQITRENILEALTGYDRAVMLSSSLASFVKCLGAKNSNDDRCGVENARLAGINAHLAQVAQPIFDFAAGLAAEDALWNEAPLSDWQFELNERAGHWSEKLNEQDRSWFVEFEKNCFLPLGEIFKNLQKGVDFTAKNSDGEDVRIRAAKMVAVIKGAPDPVLRQSVAEGVNKSYGERGELYAALLNQLHGFRLAAFDRVGVTPLEVSLHQNRMSREALMAMRETILSHIEEIREAVSLRAPYFNEEKLSICNLMCPAPKADGKTPELIPYKDGIGIVKTALSSASPEISNFIDMMLKNQWLDAVVSDDKIGGAFYSRFNEFKMPRVFTSYMGTITTVLQQAHELGHAFHYWQMRDLPTVRTEFPMTLTEMASTFNEAYVRRYLLDHASDAERFDILWQELRYAANFLMNTMVRMDFELAYFEERKAGPVTAKRCVELMRQAWHQWYGESTEGADDYLWAYKLHYYKVDQLIYNYPYTVGYLLSQGLMYECKARGDQFMPFYRAALRDTGSMSLDQLVQTHFGADAKSREFWERCIAAPLESIREFKKSYAK